MLQLWFCVAMSTPKLGQEDKYIQDELVLARINQERQVTHAWEVGQAGNWQATARLYRVHKLADPLCFGLETEDKLCKQWWQALVSMWQRS